jgi:hypothetical protein
MKYQKWLMALIMLGALALFLLAGKAFAQTVPTGPVKLTVFPAVTHRMDGTLITGAVTYRYSVGACPSVTNPPAAQTAVSALPTHTFMVPAGTYCARVEAIEAGGGTSASGFGPNSKDVVIAPPEKPAVTISSISFTMKYLGEGKFRLVRSTGSVAQGLPCELIPNDQIEWLGLSQGKVAVCGTGEG